MSLLLRWCINTVRGGFRLHANRIHPWYIKSSRTYVGSLGSIQPFIHVSRGAVEKASHRPRRIYSSSGLDGSSLAPFKLIIYSKDECPLCDKLKDKVRAILDRANFATSSPFTGIELEIRNIKSNAQWEAAYSLSIPVLAYETLNDNVEKRLPPMSPRLTAEALEKQMLKAIASLQ